MPTPQQPTPNNQQPITNPQQPSTNNQTLPNNQQPSTNNQQDEVLIKVENVGKKFCRSLKKSLIYGMQDVSYDLLGKDRSHASLRKQEFWAKGIFFELKRGECLGHPGPAQKAL